MTILTRLIIFYLFFVLKKKQQNNKKTNKQTKKTIFHRRGTSLPSLVLMDTVVSENKTENRHIPFGHFSGFCYFSVFLINNKR